jgi:hypothetical protein
VDGGSVGLRLGVYPLGKPGRRDLAPLPEIADVNDFDFC